MQILIHGLNFSPEQVGIGKYTGELAIAMDATGHSIHVVTTPAYYPEWKIHKGFSGRGYSREKLNNVSVIRCPLWVPKKPTGLKRIVHLATFGVSSIPAVFWKSLARPDVIFVIEPSMFCLPTSWFAAKLCGAKLWLHIQDFEVDAAFELGILKSRFLKSFVGSIEAFMMRRFDRVSSISPKMLEKAIEKGVDTSRIRLFPNWVDCNKIFPIEHSKPLKEKFELPSHKTIALYAGNMGEKQGIEIIVDSARKLAIRDDLHFVLCGLGAAYDRLRDYAEGVENITWLPIQEDGRFNDLMNAADIHMLPQKSGTADLVMPSKLTGMLASGRPIVAVAEVGTEIHQVVSRCGIVVEPDDLIGFANAIEQLHLNREQRIAFGHRGREFAVKNLSMKVIINRFVSDLVELTS